MHYPAMAVKQQRRRGRPPATQGEREDTRGLLLEAAAKLIAERGYRGTSVNDVIARAGLSKGTFYWHFRSKHELLVAVLDERFDRPVRELAELLKTASAQEDMAPEASRRFLELVGRRRETVVLEHEYRSLAVRDARLRARYRRLSTPCATCSPPASRRVPSSSEHRPSRLHRATWPPPTSRWAAASRSSG